MIDPINDHKFLQSEDRALLRRAYAKLTGAQEVMRFLSEYFRDKYHLSSLNSISEVGEILGPSMEEDQNNKTNGTNGTGADSLSGEAGISNEKRANPIFPDLRELSGELALHREANGDT